MLASAGSSSRDLFRRHVLVRAVSAAPVLGALADPVLELHGPPGFTTIINDNCDVLPIRAALLPAG